VSDLVCWTSTIHGRMQNRVVQEHHALLGLAIPAFGVILIGRIEVGVGIEGGEERGFVVGSSTHVTESESLPRGDGVTATDQVFTAARRAVERVSETAVAGIGLGGEHSALRGIMQGVVEARNRSGTVTEGRVFGHVLHALAVDPHLAVVTDTLKILDPGKGQSPFRCLLVNRSCHDVPSFFLCASSNVGAYCNTPLRTQ